MGYRINKRLGYGFVFHPCSFCEDGLPEIINRESPLFEPNGHAGFKNDEEMWKDYIKFADTFIQKDPNDYSISLERLKKLVKKQSKKTPVLHDVFRLDELDEYSDDLSNKVLLITPPGEEGWVRNDSIIDYVEEDGMENRARHLKTGIWPYNGAYIRKDSLERITGNKLQGLKDLFMTINDSGDGGDPDDKTLINYLAEEAGFTSPEEAVNIAVSKPPNEAVAFALWGQLFKNEADSYRMEALHYTFWE